MTGDVLRPGATGQQDLFGPTTLLRRHLTLIVTATCVVLLAVPIIWTSRAAPIDVPFLNGTAWLSSEGNGEVTQVNGSAGRVESRLPVGDAENMVVHQTDDLAVVEVDGELFNVDLAALDWVSEEGTPVDGQVVLGSTPDGGSAIYLLAEDGTASQLDPLSLEVIHETDLGGQPGTGIVAAGRLVVPVQDGTSHRLLVVDFAADEPVVGAVEVGASGDQVELAGVGDDVAVANVNAGTLRRLDPTGSPRATEPVEANLPTSGAVLAEELPAGPLWMADPQDGRILVFDLDTGGTVAEFNVADAGNDLAAPVALGNLMVTVDRSAGMVLQFDATSMTEISPRERLGGLGMEDPSRAEVSVEDGRIFINDPAGPTVVVLDEHGTFVTVDKYDATADGEEDPEVEDPDEGENDEGEGEGEGDEGGDTGGDTNGDEAVDGAEGPGESTGADPSPGGPPDTSNPPDDDEGAGAEPPPPSTTPPTTAPPTTPPTTAPPEPPGEPPGAIDNLEATPADRTVILSWSPAASPPDDPATYYIASDPAIGGEAHWTTEATDFTFPELSPGTVYTFTLTPRNTAGNGPNATVTVTTPEDLPPGPENAYAVFNDPRGGADASIEADLVGLIEATPPGATIHGAMHTWTSAPVADALVDAHDRGVEVNLALERHGWDEANLAPDNQAIPLLQDAGFRRFVLCDNPETQYGPCISNREGGRPYNKNFAFSQVGNVPNVVFVSSGALTPQTQEEFNNAVVIPDNATLYNGFVAYTDQLLAQERNNNFFATPNGQIDAGNVTTAFGPRADSGGGTDPDPATDTIVEALETVTPGADCEVSTAQAFFTSPRAAVAEELVDLAEGGCDVRIVQREGVRDSGEMDEEIAAIFNDSNVQVRDGVDDLHSSYLVIRGTIDGQPGRAVVMTGSHNLNTPGLRLHDNTLITVELDGLVAAYEANFDLLWRISRSAFTDDRTG